MLAQGTTGGSVPPLGFTHWSVLFVQSLQRPTASCAVHTDIKAGIAAPGAVIK